MTHRYLLVAVLALVVPACGAQTPTQTVAASSAATATAAPVPGRAATVTRVVDGDTIEATDPAGTRIKIRVLGIDTPETKDPRKPVQCWGPEATAYAERTLLHQPVTIVTDPTQDTVDRYQRVLAHVHLADGTSYGVLAAQAGMARAYTYRHPTQETPAIEAAQRDAQAARRGLWGACQ